MSSLAFLNKKGFHTGTIANQERVWLAEQKHAAEQRRLQELQKELQEEREVEELRRVQRAAGLVPKQQRQRLDWMYQGPALQAKKDAEEELVGDKPLDLTDGASAARASTRGAGDSGVSAGHASAAGFGFLAQTSRGGASEFARVREDPMFAIRQAEAASRKAVASNPVRMQRLRGALLRQGERKRAAAAGGAGAHKDKRKRKKSRSPRSGAGVGAGAGAGAGAWGESAPLPPPPMPPPQEGGLCDGGRKRMKWVMQQRQQRQQRQQQQQQQRASGSDRQRAPAQRRQRPPAAAPATAADRAARLAAMQASAAENDALRKQRASITVHGS